MRAQVTCGWCRASQRLHSDCITLHLAGDAHTAAAPYGHYRFVCSSCESVNWKPAPPHVFEQLRDRVGVRIVIPRPHPEDPPDCGPMTISDVHDFLIDLELGRLWQELER